MSWVEKYRPDTLDDIIGQESTVNIMKSFVEEVKQGKDEMPHFLFSGPTGVGKTATAQAFAMDLWDDEWQKHWSPYNASNDRGIDVVRDEIKSVARQANTSGGFRVIFLDESDSLTKEAQSALRRIMEKYSRNTKFFLSCNYPAQLIDPIKGRCIHRKFSLVDEEILVDHLEWICEEEEVEYEKEALRIIADKEDGKVRNAIQDLQMLSKTQKVTKEWAKKEVEGVTREEIGQIFSMIQGTSEGKEIKKKNIDERIVELVKSGVTPREILVGFYDFILENYPRMTRTLVKIGEIDANIAQGADSQLQLRCFLFWLIGKVEAG